MRRRTFLKTSAGAALGLACTGPARGAIEHYPFATLQEAFAAASFDPGAPGAFTTVWTADTHYGIGDNDTILPPVLREVLQMPVQPAFFAIAGDLVCTASLSFGHVPNEKERETALAEFRALRTHVEAIEAHLPVKLALGNHDTHPGEDGPALFHTVFPERPEYHADTVEGVPFVFLNGGSSGYLDAAQRQWFRAQIERRFDPDASLMTVCHQPSLGRVTNERGVTRAYREALSGVTGDCWLIGGHHHHNLDECFQVPGGIVTQATITAANPSVWGTEKPGYWIYGFRDRKLAVRVFRRIGAGYAVAPAPPRDTPQPLRLPFEDVPVLWKVLVGEGDEPYRVSTDARWCQNYWYYTKRLVYRLPLEGDHKDAARLAVLCTPDGEAAPRYFLSSDGERWDVADGQRAEGAMTVFEIPAACRASERVFVRLEACAVSGFALLA